MQLHHFDLSFDSFENAIKVPGATISLSLLFKVSLLDLHCICSMDSVMEYRGGVFLPKSDKFEIFSLRNA